jgi:hypothetical protein
MINWARGMLATLAWVTPGASTLGNKCAGLTEEEEQMCQDYINNKFKEEEDEKI